MVIKLLNLALIGLLVSGCAGQSGNEKLAKTQTSDLHQILTKGQTRKEAVIDMFGEPNETDVMDNGKEKWVYSHVRYSAKAINYVPIVNWFKTGTNDTTKKLVIVFNNGVVENFSTSTAKGETHAGLFS